MNDVSGDSAATVVHIELLGGFALRVGDRCVIAGSTGRRDPVRLAEYLALAPGRRAHREVVMDALWPDAPAGSVANRLHKAAHYLRKSIGHRESVALAADTVALFPSVHAAVEVDAAVFEQLAHRAVDHATPAEERTS
jgi:DNA-binding SARP family transcriptional activator